MIVRELVALLGVKTDTASVKKAEGAMNGVKKLALSAIAAFGGFAVIGWAKSIIESASDVNENLNVLDAAFKDSQDRVIAWSQTFAQVAGRSQYDMQQMSAVLGSVLGPMLDYNSEAAANMSMRLSELTVDLGSFYNAAEPDVLQALRAGITGEAEPLKRFGIVMNEATLKAFALREKIKGNIKTMSIAEKTNLRYNFILDQTKVAHGDAAKTSEGFANASKALMAKLKDFGTSIGLRVLPGLEKIIPYLGGGIDSFGWFGEAIGRVLKIGVTLISWVLKLISYLKKLYNNFNYLQQAIVLSTVAVIAFTKLLLKPWGRTALLIAIIVLLIEDFITFMEGGESVIGKFNDKLKAMTGIDLREFFEGVHQFFSDLADDTKNQEEVWRNMGLAWDDTMRDILKNLGEFYSQTFLGDMWRATEKWFNDFVMGWNKLNLLINTIGNNIYNVIADALEKAKNKFFGWIDSIRNKIAKTPIIGRFFMEGETAKGLKTAVEGLATAATTAGIGGTATTTAAAKGGAQQTIQTEVNTTVQGTPGMSVVDLGNEVAKQVKRTMDDVNRRAMDDFVTAS